MGKISTIFLCVSGADEGAKKVRQKEINHQKAAESSYQERDEGETEKFLYTKNVKSAFSSGKFSTASLSRFVRAKEKKEKRNVCGKIFRSEHSRAESRDFPL